ncbi:MAG: hypothetical protein IJ728_02025 [Selenomonadaceae bacterium]|nr:hypothetical protein [Selenomonadaceae bacterium]
MFGRLNERGFATLEVILMITVLGILSAVAIPRFTAMTTSANTAKVQADLSTLDTAIGLYQMDNGIAPTSKDQLSTYVQDIDSLAPPKGKIYINTQDEPVTLEGTTSEYSIKEDSTTKEMRANVKDYTVDKIGKKKDTSTTTS